MIKKVFTRICSATTYAASSSFSRLPSLLILYPRIRHLLIQRQLLVRRHLICFVCRTCKLGGRERELLRVLFGPSLTLSPAIYGKTLRYARYIRSMEGGRSPVRTNLPIHRPLPVAHLILTQASSKLHYYHFKITTLWPLVVIGLRCSKGTEALRCSFLRLHFSLTSWSLPCWSVQSYRTSWL